MIWRKNWVLFTELNDTHSEQVEVEYVLNSNNAVESQEIKIVIVTKDAADLFPWFTSRHCTILITTTRQRYV